MRKRQDELRAKLDEKTKVLMLVFSRSVGENGMLIRRYESAQLGDVFVSELHLFADGIRYVVSGTVTYPIEDAYGEDGETAEVVESHLKDLAANTRAYVNAESAGPGFYVDGVVPNNKHDNRRSKSEFGSSFHKDMSFGIYTEALTEQDEGLYAQAVERMAGAPVGLQTGFYTCLLHISPSS